MKKNILVINSIAKRSIMAIALFMACVGLNATNPIKNNANTKADQTQVPTVHNPKLDNMFRKFIENNDDKEYIENVLSTIYKDNGTFLGSALLQHNIDVQTFYVFMTQNTQIMKNNNINPELAKKIESFGKEFFKTVEPREKEVTDWAINKYTPLLNGYLKFDHKPTADEVLNRLDEIAKNKSGFNIDEFVDYCIYSDSFKENKIKNKKDTQSQSALIAYKMFMIDRLVMERILIKAGVISGANFNTGDRDNPFYRYFEKWMESTQPTGN